jgi:hypothetical protein
MIRETGLEAGDAIYYAQSCFKASSGDHPTFKITPTLIIILPSAATASVLSFLPPKYSYGPIPEARAQKGQ